MVPGFLWVGSFGFIGAICRYYCYRLFVPQLTEATWLVTLLINSLGCLGVGGLMALIEVKFPVQKEMWLSCVVGFLGAFTTFSTFCFELFSLIKDGQYALSLTYGVGAIVIGIMLVTLSYKLVAALI